MSEWRLRAYLWDVLGALRTLHGRTLTHGDVKPDNVLLDSSGRCRLADFGVTTGPGVTTGVTTDPMADFGVTTGPRVTTGVTTGPGVTTGVTTDPMADFGVTTGPRVTTGVTTGPGVTTRVTAGVTTGPRVTTGVTTDPMADFGVTTGPGVTTGVTTAPGVTPPPTVTINRTVTFNPAAPPPPAAGAGSPRDGGVSLGGRGDARYSAPEALCGRGQGRAPADIFSLALTVAELAGERTLPRAGEGWSRLRRGGGATRRRRSLLLAGLGEGLSPEFRAVLAAMLEPNPHLRPSAEELLGWELLRGAGRWRPLTRLADVALRTIEDWLEAVPAFCSSLRRRFWGWVWGPQTPPRPPRADPWSLREEEEEEEEEEGAAQEGEGSRSPSPTPDPRRTLTFDDDDDDPEPLPPPR